MFTVLPLLVDDIIGVATDVCLLLECHCLWSFFFLVSERLEITLCSFSLFFLVQVSFEGVFSNLQYVCLGQSEVHLNMHLVSVQWLSAFLACSGRFLLLRLFVLDAGTGHSSSNITFSSSFGCSSSFSTADLADNRCIF
jgi:hypothetical protein